MSCGKDQKVKVPQKALKETKISTPKKENTTKNKCKSKTTVVIDFFGEKI